MHLDYDIQTYYFENNKYFNYLRRRAKCKDLLSEFILEQGYNKNLSKKIMDDFIYCDRRCVNKLTEKEFLEIERDFLWAFDERILKIFDDYSKRWVN